MQYSKHQDAVHPVSNGSALKAPTKVSYISCTRATATLLAIIAVVAVLLAILITFWVTKGMYDRGIYLSPYATQKGVEKQTALVDPDEETELNSTEPTAEELRLPRNLLPLWYNVTLKTYVPGFVKLPEAKNLTFEAALIVKFRCVKETKYITLNARRLNLPNDTKSYQLLQDKNKTDEVKRVRRNTSAPPLLIGVDSKINSSSSNHSEIIDFSEFHTNFTDNVEEDEDLLHDDSIIHSSTAAADSSSPTTTTTTTTRPATTATSTDLPTSSAPIRHLVDEHQADDEDATSTDLAVKQPATQVATIERIPTDHQIVVAFFNDTVDMLVIELDHNLTEGQDYYIQFMYTGKIDDKALSGLYLTHYKTSDGKMRYAAVTQMEPTDARKMVPCFDEPEWKAVWKVKVIHPTGSTAISNGIEIVDADETNDPNWVSTQFQETLPMSSYLLALAVTDFQYKEAKTKRNTRFRVWARKEALHQTDYALHAGVKVLEFYEDYYGINFPLAKQDMIAFPDFTAGAMENWGLVTYREKYLLFDENLYTPHQKQQVAVVVAHELAHQWFGNLVTMQWWNDLWLNEGFATFIEYIGAEAIGEGHFRMPEMFVRDSFENALERDGRATSHPLYFPISKAEDVSEAFDSITYDKGGSLIRMIEAVIGTDNFKKGLGIYLNRHKYSNATHRDLWAAMSEAVPKTLLAWDGDSLDIEDFAAKWTSQMGYPVIEIRRLDDKQVELHQRRFKYDESALEKEKFRNAKYWYKWDVPIWYSVNGTEQPMKWLHEAEQINAGVDDLLLINTDSKGFYRVNYDRRGWSRIIEQLTKDHQQISVRTRAALVRDAFALAQADHLSYQTALNLTRYLVHEEEMLPWSLALDAMTTIAQFYGDQPESLHFKEYLRPLLQPLYDRINWNTLNTSYLEDRNFAQIELESAVIRKFCTLRQLSCTDHLIDMFQSKLLTACDSADSISSNCSSVPIPIRQLVYCEGVSQSGDREFESVFALYKREHVQVERERLLTALACSRDTFTLKRLLDLAIDVNDTTIRMQDAPILFTAVAIRDVGAAIIFDHFMDRWPLIYTNYKEEQTLLRGIINAAVQLKSDRRVAQLEAFIKANREQTRKLDIFGIRLEVARSDAEWVKRNLVSLTDWFKRQNAALGA